ncbi:tetratricopeptide repeat protein [Flavobacterium sp. DGU11]|uniref:Tetratricopeptide repeat protein n=1 Tax=Flavobacterium arundinis TaxID=3139143 RepID=A0ABU9HTJ2_9FLAO
MNTKDYIQLLNKPYSLNEKQTGELERILNEFPFLQSARAIYLKGLYNQDSFRYNTELKKTAAYTTDRSVLFDFITSEQFQSVQKKFFEDREKSVGLIAVADSEVVAAPQSPTDKAEESIKRLIEAAGPAEDESAPQPQQMPPEMAETEEPVLNAIEEAPTEEITAAEEKLEIGRPIDFNPQEKHSFAEWLQLSKMTPVSREEKPGEDNPEPANSDSLAKKLELIDKFIENNPKIAPVKNSPQPPVSIVRSSEDNSSLMTETLAKVYLEQKKYAKAIQAYEILILKYPEKSVFFADRISDIKTLQQNNN